MIPCPSPYNPQSKEKIPGSSATMHLLRSPWSRRPPNILVGHETFQKLLFRIAIGFLRKIRPFRPRLIISTNTESLHQFRYFFVLFAQQMRLDCQRLVWRRSYQGLESFGEFESFVLSSRARRSRNGMDIATRERDALSFRRLICERRESVVSAKVIHGVGMRKDKMKWLDPLAT